MTKRFTPVTAQKLLPQLKKDIRDLRELRWRLALLSQAREILPSIVEATTEGGFCYVASKHLVVQKDYHLTAFEFFSGVERLIRMGVLLSDVESGTVDFPSRLNGRDVLLCWHLGEKKIKHWHELDEEHDCRKTLIDLTVR